MSFRKLVKSGNTSFTISMPIDWVRKNNLDAGSEVSVTESTKGELVICVDKPLNFEGRTQPTKTLNIDELSDQELRVELHFFYISPLTEIHLEGKEIRRRMGLINEIILYYVGCDIIDQGSNYVKIRSFFSLDEDTNPKVIAKKIASLNNVLFELLVNVEKKGMSPELMQEIKVCVEQVKKLTNTGQKAMVILIDNPHGLNQHRLNYLSLLKISYQLQSFRRSALRIEEISNLYELFESDSEDAEQLCVAVKLVADRHKEFVKCLIIPDRESMKKWLSNTKEVEKKIDDSVINIKDVFGVRILDLLSAIHTTLKEASFNSLL